MGCSRVNRIHATPAAIHALDDTSGAGGAVVLEVQLGIDADKPWTWPVYVAAVRARKRCPVWLLVIAPDEAVAVWARTPIEITPGAPCLPPVVLGPSELPPIIDPAVAMRHPELTLLAAVAHGHDEVAVRLIPALPWTDGFAAR